MAERHRSPRRRVDGRAARRDGRPRRRRTATTTTRTAARRSARRRPAWGAARHHPRPRGRCSRFSQDRSACVSDVRIDRSCGVGSSASAGDEVAGRSAPTATSSGLTHGPARSPSRPRPAIASAAIVERDLVRQAVGRAGRARRPQRDGVVGYDRRGRVRTRSRRRSTSRPTPGDGAAQTPLDARRASRSVLARRGARQETRRPQPRR